MHEYNFHLCLLDFVCGCVEEIPELVHDRLLGAGHQLLPQLLQLLLPLGLQLVPALLPAVAKQLVRVLGLKWVAKVPIKPEIVFMNI